MVTDHDRYLIYSLLGRRVEVKAPSSMGVKHIRGEVVKVCRNIFDNMVEVTMSGGCRHEFLEPEAIVPDTDGIVFIYGGVGADEPTDEMIFKEMRNAGYSGETMEDIIERMSPNQIKKMRFILGDKVKKRSWSRKAVPATA